MTLLGNNNQNIIKTLSNSSLKADKGRNCIAVLAIMLTAVLFMALTTVLEGAQISGKNQMLRQAGTKLMVSVKNLTKEEAARLAAAPEFTVSAMEHYVAVITNPQLSHMQAAAGWTDETSSEYSFRKLEEGHYPKAEDEVACDTEVLRLLGLPCKTGSTFVMQYTAGNTMLEKQMTVCGFWEGIKYEQTASLLVSEAFAEKTVECYDGDYAPLKETGYDVRGSFAQEKDVSGQLDSLLRRLGYDPDAENGGKGFVVHHVNPVYERPSGDSSETYAIAGIGVLLILLAGYLIIYNIFRISVAKDIRLYGQLKTIGTSPKQIRYLIARQGTVLSAAGIPAGLVCGWLLGNALLPLIMANTSFQEAAFIVPSAWIWILSGAFTAGTVRISCARPGRIAGKTAPVEAVKYHGCSGSRKKHKKGRQSRHRILSMAVSNLGRSRTKSVLVVLSIALCAVLLNCVLNYSAGMDLETYVRRQTSADFDVRSAGYFKSSMDSYQKTVPLEAARLLSQLDGAEKFGRIYCRMLPEDKLINGDEDMGSIIRINGTETLEYGPEFIRERMLYGMNEQALAGLEIIEGTIDYEKLCSGEYVVMAGLLNDLNEYEYGAQEFHAGDSVVLEIEGKEKEYTVLAVAGAASSQCMSYSKGGYESPVFAEPVFAQMFPDMKNPVHCLFDAKDDAFAQLNEQAADIAARNGLSVLTRLTAEEEFKQMQRTYSMGGILVALIFGIIGILNLVNVIFTGVIARQREFASLRSIGMTRKQLRGLVVCEGVMYAFLAGAAALLLSAVLSVLLVKNLAQGVWYMKYHFTILPAAVVCAACILLAALISAGTDRIWNRGSIIQQLRDAE